MNRKILLGAAIAVPAAVITAALVKFNRRINDADEKIDDYTDFTDELHGFTEVLADSVLSLYDRMDILYDKLCEPEPDGHSRESREEIPKRQAVNYDESVKSV